MKTIRTTQELAEEIIEQLKSVQADCYVQDTQNIINELSKALVIPAVSKCYEYKFKAMPPQGGYVVDIVEADNRDEAIEILSKKYNEICWVSSRL